MADPARTDEPPPPKAPSDAEVAGGDQLTLDIAIEALEAAEADDAEAAGMTASTEAAGTGPGAEAAGAASDPEVAGGAGGAVDGGGSEGAGGSEVAAGVERAVGAEVAAGTEAAGVAAEPGGAGDAGGSDDGGGSEVVASAEVGAGTEPGVDAEAAVDAEVAVDAEAAAAAGGEPDAGSGCADAGDAMPDPGQATADPGGTAATAAGSRGRRGRSRGGRGAAGRRTDTRDPRRARERALKILFQADVRGVNPVVTLQRLADDPAARAMLDDADDLTEEQELLAQAASDAEAGTTEGPAVPATRIDDFTRSLVLGVADNQADIDELIGRFARRWQVSRMPVVDRTVLRLATYELMHETTSPAVVINEAVELAKALSTDDSGRYVNGVLESVRKHLAKQAKAASDTPTD
jgi:transcription antitermination protein NusB